MEFDVNIFKKIFSLFKSKEDRLPPVGTKSTYTPPAPLPRLSNSEYARFLFWCANRRARIDTYLEEEVQLRTYAALSKDEKNKIKEDYLRIYG